MAICPNDPLTGRQIEAAFVRNDHLTVDNPDPGTAPLNVMQVKWDRVGLGERLNCGHECAL